MSDAAAPVRFANGFEKLNAYRHASIGRRREREEAEHAIADRVAQQARSALLSAPALRRASELRAASAAPQPTRRHTDADWFGRGLRGAHLRPEAA